MTDFKMPPMEDKDFGPSNGNWFKLGVYKCTSKELPW